MNAEVTALKSSATSMLTMTKVKDIMTRQVVTVGLDDTLGRVKEIFDKRRFHHVLVLEEGKLVAVVSDRDLLRAISPNIGSCKETYEDAATLNKRVHQIATRKLITLLHTASLQDAADIFNKNRISCIPVVDNFGDIVGILSLRDLLRAITASN